MKKPLQRNEYRLLKGQCTGNGEIDLKSISLFGSSLSILMLLTGCGTSSPPTKVSYDGSTFVKSHVWTDAEFLSNELSSYAQVNNIDGYPAYFPIVPPSHAPQLLLHSLNLFFTRGIHLFFMNANDCFASL